MFGPHPNKIKFKTLILLTVIGLSFNSCKKNSSSEEMNTDVISRNFSNQKLLDAAKQYYMEQKNAPIPDNQKHLRPIDFLVPDWKSVKYTTNSNGEKILGVSLSFSDYQYNELNVLIRDGVTYGVIKRYDHTSKESSNLSLVSPNGFVLGTGIYSETKASGKIQLSYKVISQSYKPKFTKMEETTDGGELEEVVITPGGGGGSTYIPVVFPPSPVITNPSQPFDPGETGAPSSEPEAPDNYPDYSIGIDLPLQTMPTKTAFIAAFPNLPAQQIYDGIGGEVQAARVADPVHYNNACALRVSVALNKTGVTIPLIPGKTKKGKDGKNYIYRIGVMEQFLAKTFGEPTTKMEFPTVSAAKYVCDRSEGIYVMTAKNSVTYGASGHTTYVNNGARSDLGITSPGALGRISIWSFSTN